MAERRSGVNKVFKCLCANRRWCRSSETSEILGSNPELPPFQPDEKRIGADNEPDIKEAANTQGGPKRCEGDLEPAETKTSDKPGKTGIWEHSLSGQNNAVSVMGVQITLLPPVEVTAHKALPYRFFLLKE